MSPPAHYDKPVTPWDLQQHMETMGSVFIDARRTDVIEYAFRVKGSLVDQIADLEKAAHCAQAAADALRARAYDPSTHLPPVVPSVNWRPIKCPSCGSLTCHSRLPINQAP